MPTATRKVTIPNRQGLHARPIAMIVAAAKPFAASLQIRLGTDQVDGKNILQLMTLAAGQGTVLELVTEGDDAAALIETVAEVIESGFGEEI